MYKKIHRLIYTVIVLILTGTVLAGCTAENPINTSKEVSANRAEKSTESLMEGKIQKDNIINVIKDLSSEKYEGRLAGSAENALAARYISNYFKKIGLENPKGLLLYIQAYTQPVIQLTDKPTMQVIDNKGKVTWDLHYPENFVLRRLSSETDTIDIKAPMYLVEDRKILEANDSSLAGKILLIPWNIGEALADKSAQMDMASACGAAATISEFDLEKNEQGYSYLEVKPLAMAWDQHSSFKPSALVDSDTFAKLAKAAKEGGRLHFSSNTKVNANGTVFNIAGVIPGCDPQLKDDCIIIGAHFDGPGGNMDGSYNPGTLDNASGVSVMMELARVIKESKVQPRKTILFVAFNGEESGSFGAGYYTDNPIYPLNKSVMINLDMIGAAGNAPLTIAAASAGSDSSIRDLFTGYAGKMGMEYVEGIVAEGDHAAFDRKGIPTICLTNKEFKTGYHSPHDTISTVDAGKIVQVAKLVMSYIRQNAY